MLLHFTQDVARLYFWSLLLWSWNKRINYDSVFGDSECNLFGCQRAEGAESLISSRGVPQEPQLRFVVNFAQII